MRRLSFLRTVAASVSIGLVWLGFAQAAHAGIIGTERVIAGAEQAVQVEQLHALLASDEVRAQLVGMGVDPDWAAARVAGLTPDELASLNGQLDQLPAGAGVIEIVGIVFIVLLILELTGVIDIFKKV